ncbi:Serralysin [Carnimonas sp. R-84981]|uniref:serralysin family metalloprotease n=1 Tax=Carnimonas bestiolae TaxID=3402172 RepID=UPI003EDBF383
MATRKPHEYDSALSSDANDVLDVLTRDFRGGNSDSGLPSFDNEEAGAHIGREDQTLNGSGVLGRPVEVTYSFPDWSGVPVNAAGDRNLSGFDQNQQHQARLSLQSWADVANITFEEVSPNDKSADINFGNFVQYGSASSAYAFLPTGPGDSIGTDLTGREISSQVWVNQELFQDYNVHPTLWNYGRETLTHEIGHALGLSHPGDYNAGEGSPSYADSDYVEDSRQYSLMSYWSEGETGADHKGFSPAAPMLDDIAAIQRLYGANEDTRTGDTTYGFNSNADRDFYSAEDGNDPLIFAVWDAGGINTFDFSGYSDNQVINLNQLSFSDVGGLKGNIAIADGVDIHNAIGGSGNDLIIGNDLDNELSGGAGNDILYGGAGADTLTGGSGADTFVYLDAGDSTASATDLITDFTSGEDVIDLTGVAEALGGLSFADDFSGQVGDTAVAYDEGQNLSELGIDTDGSGTPSFLIDIVGAVNLDTDVVA